jgi:hypothetical protein
MRQYLEIYALHLYILFFTVLGIILYINGISEVSKVTGCFLMICGGVGHLVVVISAVLLGQNIKK